MAKSSKPELTPKKHHGYAVVLCILGSLLPPLAVAARFGLGGDFFLNLLLTICGYIPGHLHNFYIQNIRNNKNHQRTPKWAQRYGLVDTSEIQRKERKSQWARRYNDRLPRSVHDGQPLEEGQEASSSIEVSSDGHAGRRQRGGADGDLWRSEDEAFYNDTASPAPQASNRWRYPANFNDAVPPSPVSKKSKKKDRWARTDDAHNMPGERHRKKSKKSKKTRDSPPSNFSRASSTDFPEDAEGELYGERANGASGGDVEGNKQVTAGGDNLFDHQF